MAIIKTVPTWNVVEYDEPVFSEATRQLEHPLSIISVCYSPHEAEECSSKHPNSWVIESSEVNV